MCKNVTGSSHECAAGQLWTKRQELHAQTAAVAARGWAESVYSGSKRIKQQNLLAKARKVRRMAAPPAWLIATGKDVAVAAGAFLEHVMSLAPLLYRLPTLTTAAGGCLRHDLGRGNCLNNENSLASLGEFEIS